MKFATKAIHAGVHPDPATGAIMTPIYQTSTYAQTSPGQHKGYEYSRTHNPTRTQLQDALAALDDGRHGLAFASGMAAIDCVAHLLRPGDEVISTNDLYGGSYRIFTKVYAPLGIKFHFVPMHDMEAVKAKVNEEHQADLGGDAHQPAAQRHRHCRRRRRGQGGRRPARRR